jgi:hypothetical protein
MSVFDIHQVDLQQAQRQHRDFLVFEVVAGDLATFAIEPLP